MSAILSRVLLELVYKRFSQRGERFPSSRSPISVKRLPTHNKVKNIVRDKARLTISERTLTVKLSSLKQHIENGLTTNVSR